MHFKVLFIRSNKKVITSNYIKSPLPQNNNIMYHTAILKYGAYIILHVQENKPLKRMLFSIVNRENLRKNENLASHTSMYK